MEDNFSLHVEDHHVGGDLPLYLLRLESHHELIISARDKLAATEPVSWNFLAHRHCSQLGEVLVSDDDDVGAHPLVRHVIVRRM